ncbi:MAG: GatB/YqeY domain-containing protein [Candidatus Latescibacteria bacterium]|nr:GatB/YqeY domain-containing protein [bacterium]MBD3424526.1 GatB/YqeY domain-containing protein [Candidatus Latescibacterota bacterium]
MTENTITAAIDQDLRKALKERDRLRIDTLRMIKSALKNKQIETGDELEREKEIEVISSYARKCKESISEFRRGEREDLLSRAERELEIVMGYLPEQLSEEEIRDEVRRAIEDTGASSPRDLGRIMGTVMGKFKGKVDGSEVKQIALDLLEE